MMMSNFQGEVRKSIAAFTLFIRSITLKEVRCPENTAGGEAHREERRPHPETCPTLEPLK
jgi:hypothetical protein